MKQDFWYLVIFFLMAISLFIFLLSGCYKKVYYENSDDRICPIKCNDANTYDFDCENCVTFK